MEASEDAAVAVTSTAMLSTPYILLLASSEADLQQFIDTLAKNVPIKKEAAVESFSCAPHPAASFFTYKGRAILETKYYGASFELYSRVIDDLLGPHTDAMKIQSLWDAIAKQSPPEAFIYICKLPEPSDLVPHFLTKIDEEAFVIIPMKMIVMDTPWNVDPYDMDFTLIDWADNHLVEIVPIQYVEAPHSEGNTGEKAIISTSMEAKKGRIESEGLDKDATETETKYGLLSFVAEGIHRVIEVLQCHLWPGSEFCGKSATKAVSSASIASTAQASTALKPQLESHDSHREATAGDDAAEHQKHFNDMENDGKNADLSDENTAPPTPNLQIDVNEAVVNEVVLQEGVALRKNKSKESTNIEGLESLIAYMAKVREQGKHLPDDQRRKLAADTAMMLLPFLSDSSDEREASDVEG